MSLRHTLNIKNLGQEVFLETFILVPEITVQIFSSAPGITPWIRAGWLNIYDSLIDSRGRVFISSYKLFVNQSRLIVTNIPTEAYSLSFRPRYYLGNLQMKIWY
jgi:hypothetical protein